VINDSKHSTNEDKASKFKALVVMERVRGRLAPGRERGDFHSFEPSPSDHQFSVNNLFNGFEFFKEFTDAAY